MSSEMEPCPRCALHEASPAPCCEDAVAETAQAEAETLHACCCRHKKRSEEEYKSLIHRLNRIEGQIRGIRGMVEKRRLLCRHPRAGGGGKLCAERLFQRAAQPACAHLRRGRPARGQRRKVG